MSGYVNPDDLPRATTTQPPDPPPLITDHEFEPWRWSNDKVVCQYWNPEYPTRSICDRPASEHEHVPTQEGEA